MKNTKKNATLRSFYAEPSSEYSVIPMPEGIGNISGEKASQGFGKNWSWMVSIPAKDPSNPTSEARECSMMVGADDLAKLEIAGQVLELTPRGPQGGGSYEEKYSSFSLAPGIYEASLSYSNIDYDPPEKNVAILAFGLSVEEESIPEEQVVPTDDVPTSTKNPCPCDECSTENAGGYPGVEEFATVQGKSRSRLLPLQSSSSSAGSQVVNTADHNNMFWSSNFGIFRGMAGIPSGFLEIVVHQMSPEAYHVSSLKFNHPLAGRLNLPPAIQEKRHAGESPFANTLVPLSVGGQVNYAFIQGNAWGVGPVGSSLGKDAGFQLFGKDFAPASSSNPAEYLATLALDRSASFYSLITGELAYFVSPSKVKYSREDLEQFLHVSYDEFGSIQQIWNLWDGLVNIENVDNSSYCIALYLPSQVGTQDPDSGLYGVEGDAFKRFTVAEDLSCQGFSITEQVAGRQAFTNRWWRANDAWCMSQGEGEEAIMKLRERNTLSEDEWELITRIKKGNAGEVISSTYEKFKTTPVGNLCLSRIKGYESSCAQTSGYTYDSAGRIAKEILPDGGRREYTYDKFGRIKESFEPWAGGDYQITETSYRHPDDYDEDILSRVQKLCKRGKVIKLKRTDYIYSEDDQIRRVESHTTALGASETRMSIEETWQGSVSNPYARGRIKMSQDIKGIQTVYRYEPSEHSGALYCIISETQIDGSPIIGQSLRKIRHISPEGNEIRNEDYVLLSNNTWALIDASDYEYNNANEWIKRTRANGRISERQMMCCGPLWEKNEDGVSTSYAYNSARQLVETIRSETPSTPESITSYSIDALGRNTSIRKDIGAMLSQTHTSYDPLGRISSETDSLGRVTSYSYSSDGLTTSIISPTGASSIIQRHADGSIIQESGTGQEEHSYLVEGVSEGTRTINQLTGKREVSQKVINGFDEIIRTATSNIDGLRVFTNRHYNRKGELIQEQTDGLAGMLYSYDSMGKLSQESLSSSPPRITDYSNSYEQGEDGIYEIQRVTQYNAQGEAIRSSQAQLISKLSPSLEEKSISTDPRGKITTQWMEYGSGTQRSIYQQIPGSNSIATTVVIDGFAISFTDFAGNSSSQSRAFTSSGSRLQITDPRGNTSTMLYDIANRLISESDAAGNSTTYSYDPLTAQIKRISNSEGKDACYKYDIRGRKIAEYGRATQAICYAYDQADRLTKLTSYRAGETPIIDDPSERTDGDSTTWTYDDVTGLELSKCYPSGKQTSKSYDSYNRLASSTNARGTITSYAYAPLTGELMSISHSDEGITPNLSASYDQIGNISSISDALGTRQIQYNQNAEVIGEDIEGLYTSQLSYLRDEYGRASGYSLHCNNAMAQQVQYAYDEAHRLNSVLLNNIETPFLYSYLSNGMLKTLSYPNSFTRWNSYEEKRNLITKVDYLRPGSANYPAKVDYSYDSLGRPITRADYYNTPNPDISHSYSYNERSELTADAMTTGHSHSYSYDNIGNRVSAQESPHIAQHYSSNVDNQYSSITSEGGEAFLPEYDADGNQSKIRSSTGEWQVLYDANNRPIRFSQGSRKIECLYDYKGRRIAKKTYKDDSLVSSQCFVYDRYLQIAELDGTHATASQPPFLRKSYFWDPSEPEASRVLAQTLYNENGDYIEELYFCHDAQKNTTALFGILGGRRALYEYGAYGLPLKSEGNAAESNPFRYSSEYHDTELGLIYYNYRHYNPSDGRWLTRDPLGEEETRNLYRFVNNNPVFWGDALGLQRTIEEGVIQQQYYQDYSTVCINLCKNRITGILLSDLTKSSLGNIPSSQKTDELFGKASQSIASSWAQGFGFDITVQASISTNSTNILARDVALNITGKATYDLYNSQLKLGNDIMHLNAGPTPSKAQRQASVVTGVNFPVGINKNIRVTGEVKFQDGKVSEGIISFCVNIIF